jgi:hypothetical protein
MKVTKNLERNWRKESNLLLAKGWNSQKPVIERADLNKEERTHDREAHKKLAHQPPSSSNSVLPETSEKIITSAWITLAILGCTLLVTFYGETM